MQPLSKTFSFTTHITVALFISLVVNFSYLLSLLAYEREYTPPELREAGDDRQVRQISGTLHLHPDGYGYLTECDAEGIDSVYVQPWRLRFFEVGSGDAIEADIIAPSDGAMHWRLISVKSVNGEETDYGAVFNRPRYALELVLQIAFYLVFSLLMIVAMTTRIRRTEAAFGIFAKRISLALLLTVGMYFLAPVVDRHTGVLRPVFFSHAGMPFDTVVILKCSFSSVVAILYAFIYMLVYQRQSMLVENERLKSENIATRYDMLVSQINPHFFFNSLNSLAALVRENDNAKALTYIDTMSYTFRYILQNGQNMTVSLREELQFAEAYSYLFKIRYADKIFFDIEADEQSRNCILPPLSLQPLIDNAVKHNAITSKKPMHVSIRTENGCLVVSNPKYPLLKPAAGTGTGLKNLSSRWLLIAGCDIEIEQTADTFTVRLPLMKPENMKTNNAQIHGI